MSAENINLESLSQEDLNSIIENHEAWLLELTSLPEDSAHTLSLIVREVVDRRLFVDDYNSDRTLVGNLDLLGNDKPLKIQGLVGKIRNQKNVYFFDLQDHTWSVQCIVWKPDARDEISSAISELSKWSAVTVRGTLKKGENAQAKNGFEIQVTDISVDGIAKQDYPIQPTSSLESKMDSRHISLRDPESRLIFQIQTALEESLRDYWTKRWFIEIHSPKLMWSQSESGSELFKLEYFWKKTAYLAQSPQFYKQLAMTAGFDKVFEIWPVFRANPSFTSRHDTEFTMIDVEMSWVESHEDVMRVEETMLRKLLTDLKERYGDAIEQIFWEKINIPETPFPRIPLQEARRIVLEKYWHDISHTEDLDPEGERLMFRYVNEEFGHDFAFITDYPTSVRPFYHMRYPDRPDVTKSFDLLWKWLEITTGAQREHRVDILTQQVDEKWLLDQEGIQNYLKFFANGAPPHGWFWLWLTRMLMILLWKKSVREVTYLYRWPNRLTP